MTANDACVNHEDFSYVWLIAQTFSVYHLMPSCRVKLMSVCNLSSGTSSTHFRFLFGQLARFFLGVQFGPFYLSLSSPQSDHLEASAHPVQLHLVANVIWSLRYRAFIMPGRLLPFSITFTYLDFIVIMITLNHPLSCCQFQFNALCSYYSFCAVVFINQCLYLSLKPS